MLTLPLLQEILLSDIIHLEIAKDPQAVDSSKNPHVFEIKLAPITYYVGEDLSCGGKEVSLVSSVESGIGLEQAQHWENAIRQALMPVTPQASFESAQKGKV